MCLCSVSWPLHSVAHLTPRDFPNLLGTSPSKYRMGHIPFGLLTFLGDRHSGPSTHQHLLLLSSLAGLPINLPLKKTPFHKHLSNLLSYVHRAQLLSSSYPLLPGKEGAVFLAALTLFPASVTPALACLSPQCSSTCVS